MNGVMLGPIRNREPRCARGRIWVGGTQKERLDAFQVHGRRHHSRRSAGSLRFLAGQQGAQQDDRRRQGAKGFDEGRGHLHGLGRLHHGANLELVPGERIVQSWRSTEFAEADKDSKITVTLKPVAGGTKLTLLHTSVPDGQTGYQDGWRESYFEPMKAYFAKAKAKAR